MDDRRKKSLFFLGNNQVKKEQSMIITPKIRGFICTTAHPQGCAENVRQQIDYVRTQPRIAGSKKNVLVTVGNILFLHLLSFIDFFKK